ncbi:MAG: extracellular solute-binding protein [Erysipelotrichaceae bacterium]|nr:extracellular solute-binding protein [Erysipelotrichaceae bacterium]
MKKLLTLLLAVLMLLAFTGCSNGNNQGGGKDDILTELTEPVTIKVWNTYTYHQQEAFQEMVDSFNKSQDKVTVVYEPQAYQDYDSNLLLAVRNGTGPNISNRYPSSAAAYIEENLLVNLTPYINNDKIGIKNFKENLVGKVYEEITQWGEDSVYVFPIIITSEVLYYNKTLFDELGLAVPTTWEELTEVSKVIYEKKGIPGWGSDSETDTMIDRVIQLGSGFIDAKNKKVSVDEKAFTQTLEWYLTGLKEGYFRLAGSDMYHSGPFTQGNVASYIGSSAGSGYVLPYADFEVGVALIPQSGNVKFAPAWGGGLVAFDKTPEENLASYLFLQYCLDDETLAKWAIEFGAAPCTKSSIATATFQAQAANDIVTRALIETTECINWVPSVAGADEVRNAFGKAVNASFADDSGKDIATLISEATANFFKEAQAALEQ